MCPVIFAGFEVDRCDEGYFIFISDIADRDEVRFADNEAGKPPGLLVAPLDLSLFCKAAALVPARTVLIDFFHALGQWPE